MKILAISEELYPPFDEGIKIFFLSLVSAIQRHPGSSLSVLTTKGSDIPLYNITFRKIGKLFLNSDLRKYIQNKSNHIIIYMPGSSSSFMSFIRTAILRYYSNESIVTLISLQPRKHNALIRYIISKWLLPDMIFVQSDFSKKYYKNLGCNVSTLPSGVDINKFNPVSDKQKLILRGKYLIPLDKYVILHVGHLNYNRNITALIDIQKDVDNQVVIVGSTSTKKDKDLVNVLQKEGILIIPYYVDKIEELYQAADCYIFPVRSLQDAIETPLSVLEALASHIPVISTRFGGLTTQLRNNVNVHFIDNEKDILQVIREIKGKIRPAHFFNDGIFSWDAVAERFISEVKAIKNHA